MKIIFLLTSVLRTATISWTDRNLMNLIVSRALGNETLVQFYGVDTSLVLSDYDKQVDFYYKMFPQQVEVGERQSDT